MSKTLDFAASCSSDNSVILVNEIYENMMSKLKEKGGYLVNDEEKEKLKNTLWDDEGHINTAMVAQPAGNYICKYCYREQGPTVTN